MKKEITNKIITSLIIVMFAFMSIASSSTSGTDSDSGSSKDAETTEATAADEDKTTQDDSEQSEKDVDETDGSDESKKGDESEVATSETEETTMSKKEFIKSCKKLDFKKMARNPEKYIGKNYEFTCYVSSAREGGLFTGFQKYYVTYSFNLKKAKKYVKQGYADSIPDAWVLASDTKKCVWLLDNRDESDPDYVKILENDVIKVYGTFTGLTDSKNGLTGEKGEEVSLDIKYVEILAE